MVTHPLPALEHDCICDLLCVLVCGCLLHVAQTLSIKDRWTSADGFLPLSSCWGQNRPSYVGLCLALCRDELYSFSCLDSLAVPSFLSGDLNLIEIKILGRCLQTSQLHTLSLRFGKTTELGGIPAAVPTTCNTCARM